ncbi:hypothetical protein LCGC14_1028710 [marine sediment metagenome]|uniref:Uncharacterized protein n=1 Tax=marine sediment metagenome TaxID=412755 RepID=A0A0F9R134_9ZZZZ
MELKPLGDEAIKNEYRSWLDAQDDENQIKVLREVAREAQRDTVRQIIWAIESGELTPACPCGCWGEFKKLAEG